MLSPGESRVWWSRRCAQICRGCRCCGTFCPQGQGCRLSLCPLFLLGWVRGLRASPLPLSLPSRGCFHPTMCLASSLAGGAGGVGGSRGLLRRHPVSRAEGVGPTSFLGLKRCRAPPTLALRMLADRWQQRLAWGGTIVNDSGAAGGGPRGGAVALEWLIRGLQNPAHCSGWLAYR